MSRPPRGMYESMHDEMLYANNTELKKSKMSKQV